MKVGDYVRTTNGIVKIKEIVNNVMKDEKGKLHYGDFIKSSSNIIDLIEENDFINGMRIAEIINNKNGVLKCMVDSDYEFITTILNNEIESVLTKEQFEAMQYKVGE